LLELGLSFIADRSQLVGRRRRIADLRPDDAAA
jgi:hypothetical protein